MKHILIILFCIPILHISLYSDSVSDAWKSLENNDFMKAEEHFRNAITTEPKNIRAIIGLSYVLEMQQKYAESWNMYKTIQDYTQNSVPYFYAIWLNPRFSQNLRNPKSGAQDVLKKLTQKADNGGSLKAMAHEMLGGLETRYGNIQIAKDHYKKINALSDWTIIGSFENISASGFNAIYPPELEYDTNAVYEGKNSAPASWYKPAIIKPDYWLDFQAFFPERQAFFYANTFVWSPQKQEISLRTGTSGALKVFLNDHEIFRDSTETNNDFDTYIVHTELQQGWNRILIKVGYSEIDRCNFLARITDDQGNPIAGLKESSVKQMYTAKKPDIVIVKKNEILESLNTIIAEHPDWYEHYFVLADAYLRNDKAIEAELLLKELLKRSPNNGLVYWKFLDAYNRGRKKDEVISTYEKLASISKDIPDAAVFKFNQHLENEDFDRAEDMLARIEKSLPKSELYYNLRIRLYDKKKLQEKVIQTAKEAYNTYQENWGFTELAAIFDFQASRKRDTMIAMYKRFLKKDYSEVPLIALAKTYLEDSKVDEWEKTFKQLIELSPASPGFYFQMSSMYTQLQKYDKAEKMAKQALTFCPSCNVYWSKLGETYRSMKKNDDAKQAYNQALKYSPTDYDSREILREIEGKKSIFTLFGETNRDSVIKIAPLDKDHPEASAVIVSEKIHRVIYKQGASESEVETIIRVFNDKGIDYFKEYRIGYNSNSQTLIIEKAVTIKQDGKEIRADINRNMAVFKSLQKNDCIYVKYRVRNFNSGKLSKHVWDDVYFNRFFPLHYAEYAVLVPDDMTFTTTQQNMGIDAQEKRIDEVGSTMYTWSSRKEPGIVYEADMPSLEEVGKILRLSTIPSWSFLVDWYAELAQTKTETSYEIKEAVKQLIPHPELLSEQQKIAKVYEYITENIRYSMVSFRQSAFIPQKARDVLVNRIGDCKDVSTLGIAMLKELDIKADYVLVNSGAEQRLRDILPSIAFNHCIIAVRQSQNQNPLFLDLTASNFPAGVMPGADKNAFSLLIKNGSVQPIVLPSKQIAAPTITIRGIVNFTDDNAAIVRGNDKITGPLTAAFRSAYKGKTSEEQVKIMQSNLATDLPSAKLKTLTISGLDSLTSSMSFFYDYEAPNVVAEAGTYKIVRIPWRNELQTDDALSYEKRSYPVKAINGLDTSYEEITMILPQNYTLLEVPSPVELKCPAAEYSYSITKSTQGNLDLLTAKRRYIQTKTFIEPEEYDNYKQFYSKALKEDRRQLLLVKNK